MQMRGVIKIPIPLPPPSPPSAPAPIPIFDYIIDIYADKVVVTDAYGNTVATLSTVDELNNWLKNVKGKRIRVNVNAVVTQRLFLVQNEYWIFGKAIEGGITLTEGNIVLYAFAPVLGNGIDNYDPVTYTYYDVSNLRLFATFAGVYLVSPSDTYMPVDAIYVLKAPWFTVDGLDGDVFVVEADYALISNSVFRNLFVYAIYVLYLENISAKGGGYWTLISPNDTQISGVSVANAQRPLLSLRFVRTDIYVPPNSGASVTLGVPDGITRDTVVYIEYIGEVVRCSDNPNIYTLAPLPSEITYSLDPATRTVSIMNNTSNGVTLAIVYVVRTIIRF